ncbi:hypothetical protein MYU51_008461 [Penicillium brevicompactum]
MPPALPSDIHVAGDDFVAPRPGEWVRFCQWAPWARGKTAGAYRSTTISVLSTAIARDLSLRPLSVQTPLSFSEEIGQSINHIEAVLIYLTGNEVDDTPCRFCLDGHGPFPICVVSSANGVAKVCANCRWSKRQCTVTTLNRQYMSHMWRERLIETDAWNDFEEAMDALDGVLARRTGGDASGQALAPSSEPPRITLHDARLQVIEMVIALRQYVNDRNL